MIDIPNSLVKELAARRCILFLGAGIPASCTNGKGTAFKTWKDFLIAAASLVKDGPKRAIVDNLIAEKHALLALQAIRDFADPGDYLNFLKDEFNDAGVTASALYHHIVNLDAKIVITTNFDRIYETYCWSLSSTTNSAYLALLYNSDSLFDELRSDSRLIIKAHGSIGDPSTMIFTRQEYHQAKARFAHFYELLQALFLTNTIVFLGCSLTDPDISLLLEDVKIITKQDSSKPTRTHYAFQREGEKDEIAVSDLLRTYNVKVISYGPNYKDLEPALKQLVEQVTGQRAITP